MSARIAGQRLALLSERDQALLTDLAQLRVLSARQLERLHFREGSALTQARRSRRTLQRLTEDGVLHRYQRRVGGVRAGSSGYLYGLTPLGRRIADPEATSAGRIRRPWEPSAPFLAHLLAVSELYVALREAERTNTFEVLSFDAEPACWRESREGLSVSILKPDAFVRLGLGEFEEHAFVEVDLGTESRAVIRRKADAYRRHWQSGQEQAASGVFPRVLFLTDTPAREAVLARTLRAANHEDLFRVGLLRRAPAVLLGEDDQQVIGGTNA